MKHLLFLCMAFLLKCAITMGQYALAEVSELEIDSDSDKLSDTAVIRLPSMIQNAARDLEGEIKEGDPVSITLWYDGYEAHEEFNGFVSRIRPNDLLEFECEDYVYLLRKKEVEQEFFNTNLAEIVKYLADQGGLEVHGTVPEVQYTYFVIHPSTIEYALETLKKEYGFTCYIRGNKLYVGIKDGDLQNDVVYDVTRNVQQSALQYEKEDNKLFEVTAIGITEDNQEIRVTLGPEGAPKRSLRFFNVEDQASLKLLAEEEMKKLAFEGYTGYITTWGIPYVQHGSVARVLDSQYPEREGRYFVDRVVTRFGDNGFEREVHLGRKIS